MKVKIRRIIAFSIFMSSISLLSLVYSSLNTLFLEYNVQTKSRKIVEIKQEDRYYIYMDKTIADSLVESQQDEEDSVSIFSILESSSDLSNYEVEDEIEITNLATNETVIIDSPKVSSDIIGEYYIIGEVMLDEGEYIIEHNHNSGEIVKDDFIAIGNTWAADIGEEKINNIQFGLLMITLSSISYLFFSFMKKS